MVAAEDSYLFVEAFRERIREAKKKSGLTIDQVAEQSGVAKTAVIKLLSNGKVELKLNDCIALCRFFGISIDESFGLREAAPAPSVPQEVLARNRELEIENARLAAANEMLRAQIKSVHSVCYILVFFCLVLALSLVIYLVIDSQITDAGIIRGGELSFAAWMFIALIVAAVVTAGFTISRIMRRENKEDGACSNV